MRYLVLLLTIVSLAVADTKSAEERLLDLNAKIASLEARTEAHDKQEAIIYEMRDKELVAAAQAVDKRLEAMNEMRSQLKDQAATFLLRNDYIVAHADLTKRIGQVELFQANQEGRVWSVGAVLGLFLIVLQIFGFFLTKRLR